jgi:hypothetical protein
MGQLANRGHTGLVQWQQNIWFQNLTYLFHLSHQDGRISSGLAQTNLIWNELGRQGRWVFIYYSRKTLQLHIFYQRKEGFLRIEGELNLERIPLGIWAISNWNKKDLADSSYVENACMQTWSIYYLLLRQPYNHNSLPFSSSEPTKDVLIAIVIYCSSTYTPSPNFFSFECVYGI